MIDCSYQSGVSRQCHYSVALSFKLAQVGIKNTTTSLVLMEVVNGSRRLGAVAGAMGVGASQTKLNE